MSKACDYYVVMGNELIQQGMWNLTLIESKLMLYMVSKIKPDDEPYTEYPFTITEFLKFCQMNTDGGRSYEYVREALKSLKTKPLIIRLDKNRELITSWFNDAELDRETGEIKITFSHKLKPYLFQLQKKYTQYLVTQISTLHTPYSIRLFAYLNSIYFKGKIQVIDIETIRTEMECVKYPEFKDFKRYVLEPAIEDINNETETKIKYEVIMKGRKATAIQICMVDYTKENDLPY